MAALTEFDRLFVVLVSTRNPLNIGAAARAMSNLGFSRLRVVNPYEASFREARSAVGAAPVLARAEEFKSVEEAVADCTLVVGTTAVQHRAFNHRLRLLPEAAPLLLRKLSTGGPVAILFGSEKRGLSNDDLSYCHWLVHIPTREEHVSMNLGQAVAVCLYELARMRSAKRSRSGKENKATGTPAKAGELTRMNEVLLEALRDSGYLPGWGNALKEEKIRRMLRRMNLSADDAEMWLGMLRQILWKMRTPGKAQ